MLKNLPLDVLERTANYLDKNDILNLAKTCRMLYKAILPRFYRHIRFKYRCIWSISRLVHTLLEHRHLARSVQSLSLPPIKRWCSTRQHDPPVEFDDMILIAADKICGETKEDEDEWADLLENGPVDRGPTEDAWLALILPFLPRLEKVDIRPEWWDDSPSLTTRIFQQAHEKARPWDGMFVPFLNLKEVSGIWSNPLEPINVDSIVPIMMLPSVRKVTCAAAKLHPGSDWIRQDPGTSKVKDLSITMDTFHFGYMDLMRLCESLESISIVMKDGFGDYIFPQVREFLRHANTLRKLTFLWFEGGWSTQNQVFGSLETFDELMELHVRGVNLVHYNRCDEDEEEEEDSDDEDVPFLVRDNMLDNMPPNFQILRVDDVTHYPGCEELVHNLVRLVENFDRFPSFGLLEIGGRFLGRDYLARMGSYKKRPHRLVYEEGEWSSETNPEQRSILEPLCRACEEQTVTLRILDPVVDPSLRGFF